MYWNLIWKKSRLCPIWGQSDPLWAQICWAGTNWYWTGTERSIGSVWRKKLTQEVAATDGYLWPKCLWLTLSSLYVVVELLNSFTKLRHKLPSWTLEYSDTSQDWVAIFGPKGVKLAPNRTKTGGFQIKMYWNMIWKTPGFISFGSNLTHFWPISVHLVR